MLQGRILIVVAAIAMMVWIPSPRAEAYPMIGCPLDIVAAFEENGTEDMACATSWCESRWEETATGGAGERGLFQIHPIHGALSSYDRDTNIRAAYILSKGGRDWSQWSCG